MYDTESNLAMTKGRIEWRTYTPRTLHPRVEGCGCVRHAVDLGDDEGEDGVEELAREVQHLEELVVHLHLNFGVSVWCSGRF